MARVFTDAGAMKLASGSTKVFGASVFACAFWIYRTAAPAAERGLMGAGDFASDFGWWLNITTGGLIKAIAPYATVAKARQSSTATTLNGWTHVVVNYLLTGLNSTDFTFFINGKSEAGTSVSNGSGAAPANSATPFFVGPSPGTDTVLNTTAPPANIGPIAVWSRLISPAEALALAAGAHPLRFKEGLVETWDMASANWEDGYLGKLTLVQGATIPANSAVNPPVESIPFLWETRQNTMPRSLARARYLTVGGVNVGQALSAAGTWAVGMASQKGWMRSLSVATGWAISLARIVQHPRTLSVSSTMTPALGRVAARFRALAVGSTFSAVIVKAKPLTLAVTAAFGAGLTRALGYGRTLAVGSTLTATLSRQASRFKTFAVSSTFGVLLARQSVRFKTLPVSSTLSPVMTAGRGFFKTLAATTTFTLAIARHLVYGRSLGATSGFSPSVVRRQALSQLLSAASSFTPSVIRRTATSIRLAVTSAFNAILGWIFIPPGEATGTYDFRFSGGPRLVGTISGGSAMVGRLSGGPAMVGSMSGGPA